MSEEVATAAAQEAEEGKCGVLTKAEAEDVEAYAASALDDILGTVNDNFGDMLASTFLNIGNEDDGPSVDVIALLASLAIAKLGVILSVGVDWSAFSDVFGWLTNLSFVSIPVPNVSPTIVNTVIGTGLMFLQPLCVARMNWLSWEHQHYVPEFPSYLKFITYIIQTELRPQRVIFTQMCWILWGLFILLFIPIISVGDYVSAGMIFLFFGCPAFYFTCINFFRCKTWQMVELKFASVVKMRQYENMCMAEGTFLLFIFVAAYAFIMNFYISLMADWNNGLENNTDKAFLVIGFCFYSVCPLVYLYKVITDEHADRTFRMFREQLVSAFNDKNMYTKLVLLFESVLFSMTVVLFATTDMGQLVGGFVLGLIFLAFYLLNRPYEDDMENYSDIIARVSTVIQLLCGIILASSDSASTGVAVVLILVSLAGTAWFMYTLDVKELLLNKFFLMLQIYAQAKAMTYNEDKIRKMPTKSVRQLTNSPIEFYVLSALQKINFATLRKDDFFNGGLIKSISEMGVTWLDLQHNGLNVTQLLGLGFTSDELMEIDAELDDMGDRSDIEQLYINNYNAIRKAKGDCDREVLCRLHNLGLFYKDMGEHVVALKYLHQCLERRTATFGKKDEDTMVSQLDIGTYYLLIQRSADGTELLRECVANRTEVFGLYSPLTLEAMGALGMNLSRLNFHNEAVKTLTTRFKCALSNAEKDKLRWDHPCTFQARLDLANAYLKCGLFKKVDELHLPRIMNRQKTLYGVDSRETLKFMDEYVLVLKEQSYYNKCVALCLDCVIEKTATLGPEHSSTVHSQFLLGEVYIQMGNMAATNKLNLPALLKLQEEKLGISHPTTITSKVKLGGLCSLMDRDEEAIAIFKECIELRTKQLGADHVLTLGLYNNIASCYHSLGKYKESQEVFDEVLEKYMRVFGPEHVNTIPVMLNGALPKQYVGDLDGALEIYSKCYETCMKTLGEKHALTCIALNSVASVYLLKENYPKAEELYDKCLALLAEVTEKSDPRYLSTLNNCGSVKRNLQKMDESFALLNEAVQLRVVNYGPKHTESLRARAGLALLLCDIGRAPEAEVLLRGVVADAREVLGKEHDSTLEYTAALGHCYCFIGQMNLALSYTEEALAGYRKVFAEDHHRVQHMIKKRDWILQNMNGGMMQQQAQINPLAAAMQGQQQQQANPMAQMGGLMQMAAAMQGQQQQQRQAQAQANPMAQMGGLMQMAQMAAAMQGQQRQAQAQANPMAQMGGLMQMAAALQGHGQGQANPMAGMMGAAAPVATQSVLQQFVAMCQNAEKMLEAGQHAAAEQQFEVIVNAQEFIDLANSPEGVANNVAALRLQAQVNYCLSMYNQGKAEPTATMLEQLIPHLVKVGAQGEVIESCTQMFIQICAGTQQHPRGIALYTALWEAWKATNGEVCEPAISAVNNRGMYYFSMGDYKNAEVDLKKTMELLVKLQGSDHPDTVGSLEQMVALFKTKGIKFVFKLK